ncbi:MAG: hypothetical protein ACYC25_05030 [Paludibacter sp.]
MKRLMYYMFALVLIATVAVSCQPVETNFDETLLTGKWQSGTVFYKYSSDGTGGTWDTSDQMTETDAQGFTWTLDQATLTHIYIMEIGGAGVPKVYTVTKLTSTTLEYKDDFGKTYSFSKVI